MATQRQIQANRRNAQLSTGPRTVQGKAVSCMNALKSGLDADSQFVIGEERTDFYALQQEYFHMILPRNPCERYQMDRMLRSEWLLRRMFRAESYVWEYHCLRASRSEGTPLGESWATASVMFMRIQRRNAALEKAYQGAWDELRRVRGGSAKLPGPPPTPQNPPAEPPAKPPAAPPDPLPQPAENEHKTP